MCDIKDSNESKSNIANLEKRLNKLEEYINSETSNLNRLPKEITALIDQKHNKITKNHKELEEKCHYMFSIKEHLFSTLALFFGIFTLISVDIGLTKSIFIGINALKKLEYSIVCLITIVILQFIFCSSIYLFLVRPFLKKTTIHKPITKPTGLLKSYKSIYYGQFLLLFFILVLFMYIFYMDNKLDKLTKENSNLKSTISDLNKHKK